MVLARVLRRWHAAGLQPNAEARIDSLPQSWAVLAGGQPERARTALRSAVAHLVREDPPQVLLLTPPFDQSSPSPGYIMGYPPGIRENGGQYTHGSLWLPLAFARLGLGAEAVALLQVMNPVEAAKDMPSAQRYAGEPYVCSADVYSNPQHLGRCGWTWYTGSAAWMYRVWLESVLGFHLRGQSLILDPVLPPEWDGFELDYRHAEARYHIQVRRDRKVRKRQILVNGRVLEGGTVVLDRDSSEADILVLLPVVESEVPPGISGKGLVHFR